MRDPRQRTWWGWVVPTNLQYVPSPSHAKLRIDHLRPCAYGVKISHLINHLHFLSSPP
jgi:hypothetical protein